MHTMPILVVDDNEFIRASMMKFLETNKYKVVGAKNGADAMDKLREQTFAMVITDVLMPETDGFELIDFIRGYDEPVKSTPVIAISGGGRTIDAGAALASLEEKADVILKKPFSKKDLLEDVAKHMRTSEPKDVVLVGTEE
jgi:CheY-like chemotaxis protein